MSPDKHGFADNLRWLLRYYRPFRGRVVVILTLSVLTAAFNAGIPFIYIRIIDGINGNLTPEYLFTSIGIFLFLGLGSFFCGFNVATLRAKTNLQLQWSFRQKIFDHIVRLDQTFLDRYRLGDVVTRLTDDVGDKLCWFSCSGIFRAFASSVQIIFCLGAMFYIHPTLGLLSLIPYPLQLIIHFTSTNVLDRRFKTLQSVISRVNETIETCFSGIKIVQAYCAENRQAMRFSEVAEERVKAEISAEKSHIFVHQLYAYFWQIAQVIVLLAGGHMVMQKNISIGEFVAFNYYISFLVWPMFDIGGLLVGYRRAAVSMHRLREFEAFKPLVLSPDNPKEPQSKTGRVEFENVSLLRGEQEVLRSISFDSADNRMVAVVGGVGSGKTSLLEMICRFFDPIQGTVKIDRVCLTQQNLNLVRHRVAYVSQEPLLFTDTIRNNIRFGRSWISEKQIIQAADAARLTDEIVRFNYGMDTEIGLRGMTVSGGQKQRIAIARALAGKPDILILDDATAHLDADTENTLWKKLYELLPTTRIFVVSHRTDTLERANLILVLKNGKLVESGNHIELETLNGEYSRIYAKQRHAEKVKSG
ncbi:ABC transporter ATP-binding protein/permease [bacterium]|nr:ABC transporter ATP-binding protein/permease [bacterium]